ncbi:phage minor tail protein G [Superficieibacter electus]|uniref:Phage minor tail protein G n=1 Tax=Superficieibacter electus TaxID=2022662 RepID=A0A2P5GI27_9ENTR|nr:MULTISPECIES: phage minor tail protein G [Superficieibacter]POP41740.1 phage minor tail protein G [Superficieibacter electus]POP42552.1 phage minor tail protein G [Superficieibacter electus]WES69160.1 phage minor tail protein G [Superficieibacter sp. HKU1]
MFLKKDTFTFNDESLTLSELSALQRIEFLDYLAKEEKAAKSSGDEMDEQQMTARLVGMSIRAGAWLVAQSLWHSDPAGPDASELHQQVLSTWPADAIGQAEMMVKTLSGMLPPVAEDSGGETEEEEGTEAEQLSAEKPSPVS